MLSFIQALLSNFYTYVKDNTTVFYDGFVAFINSTNSTFFFVSLLKEIAEIFGYLTAFVIALILLTLLTTIMASVADFLYKKISGNKDVDYKSNTTESNNVRKSGLSRLINLVNRFRR